MGAKDAERWIRVPVAVIKNDKDADTVFKGYSDKLLCGFAKALNAGYRLEFVFDDDPLNKLLNDACLNSKVGELYKEGYINAQTCFNVQNVITHSCIKGTYDINQSFRALLEKLKTPRYRSLMKNNMVKVGLYNDLEKKSVWREYTVLYDYKDRTIRKLIKDAKIYLEISEDDAFDRIYTKLIQ